MEYKGYSARVVFDDDAGVLFGEVEGLRDVVTFEATNVEDLEVAFRESVDDYLAMCAERGELPEKPYSGKFLVRVDPRLHRDIAMAAARAGRSLNAFTNDVLKSWIQREEKSAPAYPPSNVLPNRVNLGERLQQYDTEPPSMVAALQKESLAWDAWTRETPESSTPSSEMSSPKSQKSHAQTPSSKTPSVKAA